jgi:hypothetical protein
MASEVPTRELSTLVTCKLFPSKKIFTNEESSKSLLLLITLVFFTINRNSSHIVSCKTSVTRCWGQI